MAASFRSVFASLGLVGAQPVAVCGDGEQDTFVEEPVQHGGVHIRVRGEQAFGPGLLPYPVWAQSRVVASSATASSICQYLNVGQQYEFRRSGFVLGLPFHLPPEVEDKRHRCCRHQRHR